MRRRSTMRRFVNFGVVFVVLGLVALVAGPPRSTLAQGAVPKIAVIDIQRVMTESAPGRAALAELQAFARQQEAKLGAKRGEVRRLQTEMQAGRGTLPEEQLRDLQRQIEDQTRETKRMTEDMQREYTSRRDKALEGIDKQIVPLIQEMGREGGYTMIFRKFESGLLYAAEEVEITEAVIARAES
jgi:outer membrane protein